MKKSRVVAGLLALSFCMSATPAYADQEENEPVKEPAGIERDVDAENKKTVAILGEYGINQQLVDDAKAAVEEAQEGYAVAVAQEEALQERIRELDSQLVTAQNDLSALEGEVIATEAKIEEANVDFGRMAAEMYKRGGVPEGGVTSLLTMDSKSINDKSRANYMADRVMSERSGTIEHQTQLKSVQESNTERQSAVQNSIKKNRDEVQSLLDEAEDKRSKANEQKQRLESALGDAESAALDAKKRYEQAIADSREQLEAFRKLQEELMKKEGVDIQQVTDAKDLMADSDLFPIMNPTGVTNINSGYGWRKTPAGSIDYGGVGGYVHTGVDYAVACGTPVKAVADGEVWLAGPAGTAGNAVAISHGVVNGFAFATKNHHLSVVGVKFGDTVKKGDVIGLSGTTGNSTGCHLHFETLVNGKAMDPELFLVNKFQKADAEEKKDEKKEDEKDK